MPKICSFLGISIYMYYDEHNPPHFHAEYSGQDSIFIINPLEYSKGNLSPRIVGLVMEWATIHKNELLDNWKVLKENGKCKNIKTLV